MPHLPAARRAGAGTGIVEVLSPKTASHDRGEKKAIYERNGVREYWLIDSRSREITIFQLVGDRFDRGTVHPAGDSCASHGPPRFYQVHLGQAHFQRAAATVLPFARLCDELNLP